MDPLWAALAGAIGASVVWGAALALRRRQRNRRRASRGSIEAAASTAADLVPLVFAPVTVLRGVLEAAVPEIRSLVSPEGTVALLFSDIADSTRLNAKLGDEAWAEVLREHDRAVRAVVRQEGGRVVKTQGDGFMAAFHDAPTAVGAAVVLQDAVRREAGRDGSRIRLRVGVHVGEVVSQRGDYFGTNVAVAARVAAAGDPGDVLVTDEVARELDGDERFTLSPQRRRTKLKGISGRRRLHVVRAG